MILIKGDLDSCVVACIEFVPEVPSPEGAVLCPSHTDPVESPSDIGDENYGLSGARNEMKSIEREYTGKSAAKVGNWLSSWRETALIKMETRLLSKQRKMQTFIDFLGVDKGLVISTGEGHISKICFFSYEP